MDPPPTGCQHRLGPTLVLWDCVSLSHHLWCVALSNSSLRPSDAGQERCPQPGSQPHPFAPLLAMLALCVRVPLCQQHHGVQTDEVQTVPGVEDRCLQSPFSVPSVEGTEIPHPPTPPPEPCNKSSVGKHRASDCRALSWVLSLFHGLTIRKCMAAACPLPLTDAHSGPAAQRPRGPGAQDAGSLWGPLWPPAQF